MAFARSGDTDTDDTEEATMAGSKTTTDHDEIQRWAQERDGAPACVRGTGGDDDPGLLRIDFPGGTGDDTLEHIDWDEWFQKFDDSDLLFLYQEEKKSGEESTFFKLVSR
jgi:hypothetical protein